MNVERNGGICRILITDDPIFREFSFSRLVLAQVQDGDQTVVLDLKLVTSLHSPGLANLVTIHVSLQKRGKKLELVGLSEQNRRLIKATNLDQFLNVR